MGAMPQHNKLGAIVALIAIGLLASFALTWPARDVELYGLSFTLSGRMLLELVLVGLAWTGADVIVRQHPKVQPKQLSLPVLHGVLPAALIAAAWTLLARLDSIQIKMIGVTVTCGVLVLLIVAEYYVADPARRWQPVVQFFLRLMAYLLATLLYLSVRLSIPSHRTATLAITAVTAILGLRLLGDDERLLQLIRAPAMAEDGPAPKTAGLGPAAKMAGLGPAPKTAGLGPAAKMAGLGPAAKIAGLGLAAMRVGRGWLCVLGLGILSGATCHVFDLWMASPLAHSLVLVVFLYVGVGISRHFLLGELTQRVAVEYFLVGVAVLLLLLSYVR
jgi:hypothetical protein